MSQKEYEAHFCLKIFHLRVFWRWLSDAKLKITLRSKASSTKSTHGNGQKLIIPNPHHFDSDNLHHRPPGTNRALSESAKGKSHVLITDQ